jgi:hypothetical protein
MRSWQLPEEVLDQRDLEEGRRFVASVTAMRDRTAPRPVNPRLHPVSRPSRWPYLLGAAAVAAVIVSSWPRRNREA